MPDDSPTPLLFKHLKPGERQRETLDVTIPFGPPDEYVRVIGFEPLDLHDLAVLRGLVAMAAPAGSEDAPGQEVEANFSVLLGYVGASAAPQDAEGVRASLLRLSGITLVGQKGRRQMAVSPMSYEISGPESAATIKVKLNLREVMAMLGAS